MTLAWFQSNFQKNHHRFSDESYWYAWMDLKPEINERIEIGDQKGADREHKQHDRQTKHNPRKPRAVAVGEDYVLQHLSFFQQGDEREQQCQGKDEPEAGRQCQHCAGTEGEKRLVEAEGLRKVVGSKQYPAKIYDQNVSSTDGSFPILSSTFAMPRRSKIWNKPW